MEILPDTIHQKQDQSRPRATVGLGERYLTVVRKHKLLILVVFILVAGAAAAWTMTRVRIYGATTTLLLDRRAPQVLGKEVREVVDTSMGAFWRNKEYLQTQILVITSKSLALRVVKKHALARDPKFWAHRKHTGKPLHEAGTDEQAATYLRSRIQASSVKAANIIEITVTHPDSGMAARLANAIADSYMSLSVEHKLASTTHAVKWLSNQLDTLKKQLDSSELALHRFKRKNNIVSVSLEDKQNLLARRIATLNTALTEIRLKRMTVASKRHQYKRSKKGPALNVVLKDVIDNDVIKNLKSIYVRERRSYVALLHRYGDKWPAVLQQKARVAEARKDLEREVVNLQASVDSEYSRIRRNEAAIAAALQAAKDAALDLNKREVDYRRLKRSNQNTSKLYRLVLERMKEANLSAQLRVSNIRRLDRAVEKTVPIKPHVRLNIMLGCLFGLLLGVALAFVVDALDSTIKSQDEVEATTPLTFLGLMPRIPGSAQVRATKGKRPEPRPDLDLIVHRQPKSQIAESCRNIRTNLMFATTDVPARTIVVTSPGPREGKTTTALSLAIAMAQAGNSVLIVDTDMRRPRMHKVLDVPGTEGLTSVLLGHAELEDVVKTTEVPNLFLLPCGPTPPNPAEICHSESFKRLLDRLQEGYDHVLLDSPPVMAVTDAVVLTTLVDGTLIVARTGETSRTALQATARQITDVGGRLLGCVLNDMDVEKSAYSYYRYRRYGYSYGYGTEE
ncbi:MAG: polysaccharide biosynthesis tyrosine autokinase [Myxococcales bacterium]|nr:polysaccharide biosynthesis tyrosine autokinase [Myxococcales bacterium]